MMEPYLALKISVKIVVVISCAFLAGYLLGDVLRSITDFLDKFWEWIELKINNLMVPKK